MKAGQPGDGTGCTDPVDELDWLDEEEDDEVVRVELRE